MKVGDSVVIVNHTGRRQGGGPPGQWADHMGRTGIIRKVREGSGPSIDVCLDFPLPDRRQHIWFYELELQVI